ncbi:MAG: radical SAM protein [Candidatus Omnitrophica bacterium]|nr:radical SAM protein [Candidatus Omnitrophota bacterium]
MKILVLNPSTIFTKNVVRDVLYGCWCGGKRIGGGTVPPFALLGVATLLKKDGNQVEFIDAQAEQIALERIYPRIIDKEMIVISTSTMTFEEDASLLEALKQRKPSILTIAFGSHPTFLPQATLARPGVDVAVQREPEYIIRDIARCLREGKRWQNTAGIAFKENNAHISNPEYPFIDNLDDLPFPDLSLLPKNVDYFNPIVKRMPYMTVATSRGCPGKCSFCTAPAFDGNKVRFQSAEYVLEEIKYFISCGYREIYFRDDTFFVDKKRDAEICRAIIADKFDVTWIANARIGMIDKEMMRLAKAAGCHTIKFGVESGDQGVLDRAHKGYDIAHAIATFKWARELGLATHAHLMLGMPGDNEETIRKTIRFSKTLNATTATFGICTPYPGAPLYEEVLRAHPEIKDGSQFDLSKLHVTGLFNETYSDIKRGKLERYIQKAYRSFYLDPRVLYDLARQIRSADDIKRIALAGSRVLDFSFFGNKE